MEEKIIFYAIRVEWGSSQPEFALYDSDKNYVSIWSVYHRGPLPKGIKVVKYVAEIPKNTLLEEGE